MYEYERVRCQKPKGCRDCEYYQPRWRYRSCYFVRCPYALAANSVDQKIDLLRKAADLYAGPFFHSASNEHWIMATSVDYYYQYVSLMGELLKTLFDEKDFICVHKYAATALQFAPHSEDFYFWMIRSTMRVGHTEAARGELRMAQTKLLEEEYAVLIERLKEVGELP